VSQSKNEHTNEVDERFARAMSANVQELYINGFSIGLGVGDVFVIMERNGSPSAILNMSYTVAKTLAAALGNTIAQLEEKSGREMLTTNDLERIFLKTDGCASDSEQNSNEMNSK
jgi:hypothetical protein